jgi:hypothetical protein
LRAFSGKRQEPGDFLELNELILNYKRLENKGRGLSVKLFLKIKCGIIFL